MTARHKFRFYSLDARKPATEASAPATLVATWAVERDAAAQQLLARLTVRNDGPGQIHLLVAVGRRPAPKVTAKVDGQPLPSLIQDREVRVVSRVGPQPRYRALAVGEAAEIGPYRFELPPGAEEVTLEGEIDCGQGPVPLPAIAAPLARADR